MTRLELKTSGRQFRRQFLAAIRGSLIRALTELITNSDDSYRRLASARPKLEGQAGFGVIHINYNRLNRRIAVVDWAEGMDAHGMRSMIPQYGSATSGLYQGQSVRGYFGKGMKDVLFSMQNGLVESIKDDKLYIAHFFWKDGVPTVEIYEQPRQVSAELREKLDIPSGNGTRVSFEIPKTLTLPRHDSLLKNLANYYMLRLINASDHRHIRLKTVEPKGRIEESSIHYQFPAGQMLLDESFIVTYNQPFPVTLKLFRAPMALTQSGDEREGGILVFDESGSVLDLTMFSYDREDQASHLFGWLEIQHFRQLLKAEENALTDTRDGLDRHHPFYQALAAEVDARLQPVIEQERHLRMENAPAQLSKKQRQRLGRSIDQINGLLNGLIDLRFTGDGSAAYELPPEGGLAFQPKSVFLHPHTRTLVRLRIDTSQIASGSKVEVHVAEGEITASPRAFDVPESHGRLVATQSITLTGDHPDGRARVIARTEKFEAAMDAQVTEENYPMPEGGFAFIPAALHPANNVRRNARLYVHQSTAGPGDTIQFTTDNPLVTMGVQTVTLQVEDFRNGIAQVTLPVRGTGIGEKATITATTGAQKAVLFVEIVSRRENQHGSRLVTGYRFDQTTPSDIRASFDQETGLIWIYLRNPIVEHYFGNLPLDVALNTPHCQILLAEIILEQVAWVARRKMIEEGSEMYVSEDHTEEDLDAVRRFMAEYGEKIHSWIADEREIERIVQNISHEVSIQTGESVEIGNEAVLPSMIQVEEVPVPVTGQAMEGAAASMGSTRRKGLFRGILAGFFHLIFRHQR